MIIYFFLLNLISNLSFCIYDSSLWAIMCMIGLAALVAYLEDFITGFRNNSMWQGCTLIIFSVIHVILIVVDYFLLTQFGMVCNQDVIDILFETNVEQTNDFIQSYFSLPYVLGICLSVTIFIVLSWLLNKLIKNKIVKSVIAIFAIGGIIVVSYCVYSFVRYGNGVSVPQYLAPARVAWALKTLDQRQKSVNKLKDVCSNVESFCDLRNAPTIIVVIGESFSVYHCSLYGYDKATFPLLEKKEKDGNLFVMQDVVCVADATHRNMKAIFSLGEGDVDFDTKPLFPAVFKNAGYKTLMYDNQYFLGQGVTFLTDGELSSILFDERNSHGYKYDGDMLEDVLKCEYPALYVFHLWGQHYTYANRYPEAFSRFQKENYEVMEHADVIAHYDNANLYNDYVLNEIINKFEGDDALLVYFSDHGEEVYELGYMGHGTAMTSGDFRYQLRVPMFIWMSDKFMERHNQIVKKIKDRKSWPLITSDIGHFLIDVAGIETESFDSTRSFINSQYDKKRPRLVMGGWDYDKHVEALR